MPIGERDPRRSQLTPHRMRVASAAEVPRQEPDVIFLLSEETSPSMRTGTPLWLALVTCALTLTLVGCKMQLTPTTASKVWCCPTCPGYTKPMIQVAFMDHEGDPIPHRRVYVTGDSTALAYARDEQGAVLPRDSGHMSRMYVVTGSDGKATVNFEMPPNVENVPGLAGGHSFKFETYLDEHTHGKLIASKGLKVTFASSCE